MRMTGKITERIKEELSKISKYYVPVRCYLKNEKGSLKHIPCDDVVELILRRKLNSVVVCNCRLNKCLVVSDLSNISMEEISGAEVYFLVEETVKLHRGDKIGYVLTNKGEARTIKAKSDGYLFLIKELVGDRPEKYLVLISPDGELVEPEVGVCE